MTKLLTSLMTLALLSLCLGCGGPPPVATEEESQQSMDDMNMDMDATLPADGAAAE